MVRVPPQAPGGLIPRLQPPPRPTSRAGRDPHYRRGLTASARRNGRSWRIRSEVTTPASSFGHAEASSAPARWRPQAAAGAGGVPRTRGGAGGFAGSQSRWAVQQPCPGGGPEPPLRANSPKPESRSKFLRSSSFCFFVFLFFFFFFASCVYFVDLFFSFFSFFSVGGFSSETQSGARDGTRHARGPAGGAGKTRPGAGAAANVSAGRWFWRNGGPLRPAPLSAGKDILHSFADVRQPRRAPGGRTPPFFC